MKNGQKDSNYRTTDLWNIKRTALKSPLSFCQKKDAVVVAAIDREDVLSAKVNESRKTNIET